MSRFALLEKTRRARLILNTRDEREGIVWYFLESAKSRERSAKLRLPRRQHVTLPSTVRNPHFYFKCDVNKQQ